MSNRDSREYARTVRKFSQFSRKRGKVDKFERARRLATKETKDENYIQGTRRSWDKVHD